MCAQDVHTLKSVNGTVTPDFASGPEGNPLFTIPAIFRKLRQTSSSSNL